MGAGRGRTCAMQRRMRWMAAGMLGAMLLVVVLVVSVAMMGMSVAAQNVDPVAGAGGAEIVTPPTNANEIVVVTPPTPPTLTTDVATPTDAPHSHEEEGGDHANAHAHVQFVRVRHGDHEHLVTPIDGERQVAHGSHFHTLNENLRNSNFIFGVVVLVVVVLQLALVAWRLLHQRSYDTVSLFGLWIVPAFLSLTAGYVTMLSVWLVYTVLTAFVIRLAMTPSQHVDRRTPRRIFQWFYGLYYVCCGLTILGYAMFMSDVFAVSLIFLGMPLSPLGLRLIFYGLYYGVLSRDLCTFCAESMAVSIGYVAKEGAMPRKSLPENTCALCDHSLVFVPGAAALAAAAAAATTTTNGATSAAPGSIGSGFVRSATAGKSGASTSSVRLEATISASARAAAAASAPSVLHPDVLVNAATQAAAAAAAELESVMQLPCTHRFHEFCLRGWSLIGKRDTCPYCREKAPLRKLYGNPWRSQSMMWSTFLDAMRYAVVFVPVLLFASQHVLVWVY